MTHTYTYPYMIVPIEWVDGRADDDQNSHLCPRLVDAVPAQHHEGKEMDNRRGSTAVPSNPRTSKRTPYQYSTNGNGHTTPHTDGTRGQPEILRIPLSADNVHYDQPFANGFWVLQYSCYMRPRKGRGRISIQLWCEWSGIEEAVSVPPPSRCAPRAT